MRIWLFEHCIDYEGRLGPTYAFSTKEKALQFAENYGKIDDHWEDVRLDWDERLFAAEEISITRHRHQTLEIYPVEVDNAS
jgi:hypothetical protein